MAWAPRSTLSGPESDLPPYAGPVSTVLIAFTPRSGSTLLAHALRGTGLCGVPHEYLNFVHMDDFRHRLGPLPVTSLLAWLKRHRTTPNGVFGIKASVLHLQEELLVHNISPRAVFGAVRCVWIERADKVRQAVSFARANQTDQWNSRSDQRQEASYDYALIERCYRNIHEQTRVWPQVFRLLGVSPVRLQYRQLVAHYEPTVRGMVGALGLGDPATVRVPPPGQARMPNRRSQEWCARFREEATARGHDPHGFGPEEPWLR